MSGPEQQREALSSAGEKPACSVWYSEDASQEMKQLAVHAIRQSLAFSQIVSLLMQSPTYRHYALADLEWLVIPPLAIGMFAAEAKVPENGQAYHVAAVLWVSVSLKLNKRLSENLKRANTAAPRQAVRRLGVRDCLYRRSESRRGYSSNNLATVYKDRNSKFCAAGPYWPFAERVL